MLSFEVTAIDVILVLAVLVLLVLYWTKLSSIPDEPIFRGITTKNASPEKLESGFQKDYTECPRGFGKIKRIDDGGSISERCLGCYRIMECYSEAEQIRVQLNQI